MRGFMDAIEKYLNWMEGSWRKTISTALRQAFKEIQIENGDSRKTLMSLIDNFIKTSWIFQKGNDD